MKVLKLCCLLCVSATVLADGHTPDTKSARPGYMVVIARGVDPTTMGDYANAAVPLLLEYGGKLLFTTPENKNEVIEGGPFTASVRVFQFPSLQAARDFYFSEEYQVAIPLRAGNGKLDILLADAFVPDPKWTTE